MISGLLTGCGLLGIGGHKPSIPGKIVFSATDKAGTYQIFTMNADGSHRKQLTHFPSDGGAGEPSWSPDGKQIVFANYTGATTLGPYLYVMNADGSNMRPLKRMPNESPKYLIGSDPVWSPDGSKIAYDVCTNCERGGRNYEIVVVEAAGEEYDPKQVLAITSNSASDMYPTWSPDSKKIVFSSDRDYYSADTMRWRRDLYMVNADGTDLQRLTKTGNATLPKWSPDGTRIAYEWNIYGNKVFLYEIGTRQITKLEIGFEFSGSPDWNAQGNQLLVFGRKTEQSQPEVRWISLENNTPKILKTATIGSSFGRLDWHDPQN
ncbi:MAG TPA: DPP IV N-terminal domain-containing protein [Balneolales bacterium]|nr:DPP IV N-terminal domain-containing protein [Balneolales bacterium]